MLKNRKELLGVLAFFLLMVVGVFFFLDNSVKPGINVSITVKEGMSTVQIATLLKNNHLIANKQRFLAEVKAKNLENALQAGEYEFVSGTGVSDIIKRLATGDVKKIKITIPEGYTILQIATLLDSENIVNKEAFLSVAKNYTPFEYMKTDNAFVEYRAEGFLFPSTYFFSLNMKPEAVLKIMTDEFDRNLSSEIRAKLIQEGHSIREFVTFSSLVEKEAAVEEDRSIIAEVFIKRIKIQMPLQSCATIQYILGYPKPNLSIADTKIESPYNTYLYSGLPPGPIANPGIASMNAVINPSEEGYLFFVAKKDRKHIFSKTYQEHLLAIKKAQSE